MVVVGGGLAGIARRARARRRPARRSRSYEARPRLGGATHSFARDGLMRRQRPARLPALLHGVPGPARRGSAPPDRVQRPGPLRRPRPHARRAVRAAAPRRGCRARCTCCPRWRGTRRCRPPTGCAPSARRWRCGGSTPPTRRSTRIASDALARRATGSGRAARRALWELFVDRRAERRASTSAALGLAAMVFQTALLGRADAADIGVRAVPARRAARRRGAAADRRDGRRPSG